jgi:GH43 family beta-xylosidase
MKLKIDETKQQPDPFIFQDGDTYYLYVTGSEGVGVYSTKDIFEVWNFEGILAQTEGARNFWAPCVIKIDGVYYMYVSFVRGDEFEYLHVFSGSTPLGPFTMRKKLFNHFSIDAHVVETEEGLFLIYSIDDEKAEKAGTRILIDKMLDPLTPEYKPVEKVSPTLKEELNLVKSTENEWYTIEGGFWFREGEWQYLMYSGASYESDAYHIGYCAAKTTENDLRKVDFSKHLKNGKFAPVIIKNATEEGTGHHSVIKLNGEYYAIYHARDYSKTAEKKFRTARIARLIVKDGKIICPQHGESL